jgi:hypothetical protein
MSRIFFALAAAVAAVAVYRRRSRWFHEVSALVGQLIEEAAPVEGTVDLAEVETLPEPVKRFFHHVLEDGLPMISQAYLVQKGGFRVRPDAERWQALYARQAFSTVPRAFVWDAKIGALPGVWVRVCDAYREGGGVMKAALAALVSMADARGDDRLDQAALMRYLAEAVWFPTALLPSQGVRWEKIDDRRAKATITDSGHTVSLDFTFNDIGEVVSVYTPGRFREVDGAYVPTAWEGRFSDYSELDGCRFPTEAEVAWHPPEGRFPYWKATITEMRYR